VKQIVNLSTTLFVTIVFLAGCSHMILSKKEKASIQSISICKHVKKPDSLSFKAKNPPASNLGQALVSGLDAGLFAAKVKPRLRRIWYLASIDIEKNVMDELEKQLKFSHLSDLIVHSGGDAEFTIEIINYGFEEIDGLLLRPMLSVKGSLTKTDGTILWKSSRQVNFLSNLPYYNLNDLARSRDLMREAISLAANRVIVSLINSL